MTEKMKALIEHIDRKTFENLMQLDQKLNDLRHEITAKLVKEQEHPDDHLDGLRHLAGEVDKAIQSIHQMMDIEISDQHAASAAQAEDLEKLAEKLEVNLKTITKFKNDV